MWSIAIIEFGLTEEEFKNLTLKEFYYLLKQKKSQDKKTAYNFALVCATILNSKRTKSSQKVWTPRDFLVDDDKKINFMSEEELKNQIIKINSILKGTIIRKKQEKKEDGNR